MAKKKKAKGGGASPVLDQARQEELRGWLEGLGQGPEEALIRLTEKAQEDPELALAMLGELGRMETREAGWVADRAARTGASKAFRKAAKKALYSLGQKGLADPGEKTSRPVFQAARLEEPHGFLSGYYPDGCQTLTLAFPTGGGEGFCGAAVCHFWEGFREVGLAPMRLSQFRKMNRETGSELPWDQVRLEGRELAFVLDYILKNHKAAGGSADREVMFLSQWVEDQGPLPERAPAWRLLGEEAEPPADYSARLAKLLEEPPCLFWYPHPEEWERARKDGEEEGGSGLILSPELEAQKALEARTGLSRALFPEDSYPAWRHRLEEAALFLAGNDPEAASVMLAAAGDLNGPEHPLFLALIDKMEALEGQAGPPQDPEALAEKEEVSPSGLILPPGLGKVE